MNADNSFKKKFSAWVPTLFHYAFEAFDNYCNQDVNSISKMSIYYENDGFKDTAWLQFDASDAITFHDPELLERQANELKCLLLRLEEDVQGFLLVTDREFPEKPVNAVCIEIEPVWDRHWALVDIYAGEKMKMVRVLRAVEGTGEGVLC